MINAVMKMNITIHQKAEQYLTNIGGRWYFDRDFGLQRLKNQSLYDKILLLQKFNDTLWKVLNTLSSASDTMEAVRGYHPY